MIQTEVCLYKDDPKRSWRGTEDFGGKAKWLSVVQGECGSEKLQFHLMQDSGKPLDLTGKTVTFYFTKADGNRIFLAADVPAETAAQGIASVVLTAQATAVYGFVKHGEIRVTESDGSVVKFQTPDIFVNYSDSEDAIESTPEFHALDIALNKADKAAKDSQSAIASAQEVLTGDRQAVADAASAAANANSAAQAAKQAAADASSAASAANTATSSANSAAQSCNNAVSNMSAKFCPAPEYGTWTPTLYGKTTAGSPTYSAQSGFYYKVGKLVVVSFCVVLSAKGGMAGELHIGGLPFACGDSGGHIGLSVVSNASYASGQTLSCICVNDNSASGTFMLNSNYGGIYSADASIVMDTFAIWSAAGFYVTA